MISYIKETQKGENTAGLKARDDLNVIFSQMGLQAIPLEYTINMMSDAKNAGFFEKIKRKLGITQAWSRAFKSVDPNSNLIIQYPILRHPIGYAKKLMKLKREGVKICFFIHDIEALRNFQYENHNAFLRSAFSKDDNAIFYLADYYVAHNQKMKSSMIKMGIDADKIVKLEIFDYIIPNYREDKGDRFNLLLPIIVAGSLAPAKAGYLYKMPDEIECNAYGIHYQKSDKKNIHYQGSFSPDELPNALKGSFGLVWDGPDVETCAGNTGRYLRINNPHKTSLYLASGVPVIVWKEAAIAEFVLKNQCGIAIGSLLELDEILKSVKKEDYENMRAQAIKVSKKLRSGYYTRTAIDKLSDKL